jgi:hypothetical protein
MEPDGRSEGRGCVSLLRRRYPGALWVGVTIRHVMGWMERLIESSLMDGNLHCGIECGREDGQIDGGMV